MDDRKNWFIIYSIGPRSDVGQGQGQEKFFFGRTDGRTAEKKRRKNFVLGSPHLDSFIIQL